MFLGGTITLVGGDDDWPTLLSSEDEYRNHRLPIVSDDLQSEQTLAPSMSLRGANMDHPFLPRCPPDWRTRRSPPARPHVYMSNELVKPTGQPPSSSICNSLHRHLGSHKLTRRQVHLISHAFTKGPKAREGENY